MKESRWIGVAPQEGVGVEEGTKGTKGWGCTRRGLPGGGRGKRQREGSSRRAKTKKPRDDPEGGQSKCF